MKKRKIILLIVIILLTVTGIWLGRLNIVNSQDKKPIINEIYSIFYKRQKDFRKGNYEQLWEL